MKICISIYDTRGALYININKRTSSAIWPTVSTLSIISNAYSNKLSASSSSSSLSVSLRHDFNIVRNWDNSGGVSARGDVSVASIIIMALCSALLCWVSWVSKNNNIWKSSVQTMKYWLKSRLNEMRAVCHHTTSSARFIILPDGGGTGRPSTISLMTYASPFLKWVNFLLGKHTSAVSFIFFHTSSLPPPSPNLQSPINQREVCILWKGKALIYALQLRSKGFFLERRKN